MLRRKPAEIQKLQKKLKAIKSKDELFEIFKQLTVQKHTLVDDLDMLKAKVKLLKDKYKSELQFHDFKKELSPEQQQLISLREQVNQKHKILNELKKRKSSNGERDTNHQLNSQLKKMQDQLSKVQKQKHAETKKLHDAMKQNQRLQSTLLNGTQQSQGNVSQIQLLEEQNKILRKHLISEKNKGYAKQYQSAKIVNNIYVTKRKLAKSHSVALPKIKPQQLIQMTPQEQQNLKKQVSKLKEEIENIKLVSIKSQNQQKQKYDAYITQNKQFLKKQKQLQIFKTKLQTELNKYKAIWQNYQKKIQQQHKLKKQTKNYSAQIKQYTQPKYQSLRRDFAGIIGNKMRFDDRFFLQQNRKAKIKGFIIYQNDAANNGKGSIVGIRAIYNDIQANSINILPLPRNYLSKCKQFRIELAQDDFIKLFKVKFNSSESRITKIQVRSNKNIKHQFGEKRLFSEISANQYVYGFDIGIKQYPVCLFGSYIMLKGHWHLQSLGVQINQLN